mmetsp:Transcript_14466/g.29608  ORF Transcript_14466/g.29608 Transcript_14466/m.29608 type:complete len:102 (+) Transcript_14466:233-538(+)
MLDNLSWPNPFRLKLINRREHSREFDLGHQQDCIHSGKRNITLSCFELGRMYFNPVELILLLLKHRDFNGKLYAPSVEQNIAGRISSVLSPKANQGQGQGQ